MSRPREKHPPRFVMSAPHPSGLPPPVLPEFGFIGRSNVGKSSLLGMLLGQPKLVRTSKTPGQTRLLNLFIYDEQISFLDLPGYGYAKLSHQERGKLKQLIADYVEQREGLMGIVLLVDARRDEVSDLDRDVATWVLSQDIPLLVAITKSDLIPKARLLPQTRVIEDKLGIPEGSAVVCSSKTRQGRDDLLTQLFELVSEA